MDKVYGIDMSFICKRRGHSLETGRLRQERNRTQKTNETRAVDKGGDNERMQEYRPSQEWRKQIERLNILIYNRFFHFCEQRGTTPLREFQENVIETLLNPFSENESQISQLRKGKCPTNVFRKFQKHESVNLIRLKQTAKQNTLQDAQNEEGAEAIMKAEKYFSVDLTSRRNSKGHEISRCNYRTRDRPTREHILPVPPTQGTSDHPLWTVILL